MSNKVYIFDLDGTLIDSMPYFGRGILSIADDRGMTYDENLLKILTPLGYVGGAKYLIELFSLKESVEELCEGVQKKLYNDYKNNIPLKPGVREYLEELHSEGARLFVLTASPKIMATASLENNGVAHLFEEIWSVENFGLTKSDTRLFYKVAEVIGCEREEIHYFDDSLIALTNANDSGYITYAVYDAQSEDEIARMKSEYKYTVMSFADIKNIKSNF